MRGRNLCTLMLFLMLLALTPHASESKKVVIHIPYSVKNVKHTHTVYKIIPHHHGSKHEYKSDDDGDELDFYRKRR